ncbi:hypothetical protein O6H91_11G003600 [Diphasiastrum complanatum]|uniref:Uncharacterized protein n=1 Tax=Diphasiastrum complanatum TaxID=34168 RepID=A0ACC2C5W4_DIPCM|nr:hypothetical protein O6H91_11G003600 [Diphasiastrum complanatum]
MDSTHTLEEGLLEDDFGTEAPAVKKGGWLLNKSVHIDERIIVHEKLSVDEMLRKWVGEFGIAQFMHFMLVSLAWTMEALHTMVMIFADREPEWRCLPSSAPASNTYSASGSFSCTDAASRCSMDYPSAWEWVGAKGSSIVSEWGLTCKDSYKVGLVDSMFFVGAICGAGIFGNLSDSSLGRKGVLRLVCLMSGVAGLATALSPNYWIYLVLRWITGVACGGVGLSSFVLATEPVGPSRRGAVGMSAFYFFSLGIMVLPSLAYVSSYSWRHLYIFTSIPTLVYCVLVLPFVSESPRWYIVQGRMEDAMKALRVFARRNGKFIPRGVELASELGDGENSPKAVAKIAENQDGDTVPLSVDHSQDFSSIDSSPAGGTKASGSLLDIFRYAETRLRMIVMAVVWFSCAVVYYGISLNVVNIGVSLYLSVFLNAIAEMPAFAITAFLLGKLGRKVMLAGSMLLSGGCCLIATFLITTPSPSPAPLPNSLFLGNWAAVPYMNMLHSDASSAPLHNAKEIGRLVCGVVGIFGMAATYNLTYLYTAELFPTVVRNAALGLASQASQLGAVVAPLVVVLGRMNPSISFAVFAVSAITGGLLSLKLPETLNKPLWDTFEGLKSEEQRHEHEIVS